jgi:hypothetical protein
MADQDKPLTNSELNRRLCESRERLPVRDTFAVESRSIRKLTVAESCIIKGRLRISEAASTAVGDLYEAKVGQADKINQNRRIYPREVWQDNIDRFAPMIETGCLIGTDGHEANAPSDISTKWVALRMESDGGVFAGFMVVPTQMAGKSLQTCLDMKVGAIGFSTYGFGTGHAPGDLERQQFRLGPDDDATVMDRNYELERIDPVLGPSVNDARVTKYPDSIQRQTAPQTESIFAHSFKWD